jgi:hypothetical protein
MTYAELKDGFNAQGFLLSRRHSAACPPQSHATHTLSVLTSALVGISSHVHHSPPCWKAHCSPPRHRPLVLVPAPAHPHPRLHHSDLFKPSTNSSTKDHMHGRRKVHHVNQITLRRSHLSIDRERGASRTKRGYPYPFLLSTVSLRPLLPSHGHPPFLPPPPPPITDNGRKPRPDTSSTRQLTSHFS